MKVFVYGTLMKGLSNHFFCSEFDQTVAPASLRGYGLYQVASYFPGIIEESESMVLGEVYDIDEVTLKKMDSLEGEGDLYIRKENINRLRQYHPEGIGYEIVQGSGVVEGELLGGCIDVFIQLTGTPVWPTIDQWQGKIMFLETSEEDMSCDYLTWILRNLQAQGIFDAIKGILVGKPARRSKYEAYKYVYRKVVGKEAGHPEIPIMYNVNFGHAEPIGIIPYGLKCRLDADNRTLTLLEPATQNR